VLVRCDVHLLRADRQISGLSGPGNLTLQRVGKAM